MKNLSRRCSTAAPPAPAAAAKLACPRSWPRRKGHQERGFRFGMRTPAVEVSRSLSSARGRIIATASDLGCYLLYRYRVP